MLNSKSQFPISKQITIPNHQNLKPKSWLLVIGKLVIIWCLVIGVCLPAGKAGNSSVFAEEQPSSKELVKLSWEASGTNDFEKAIEYTDRCVELYWAQAKEQGATLSAFSLRGHEDEYGVFNDVATCIFIKGEIYMKQGKAEEAKRTFNTIIQDYKFAQAWDPRGWLWSVAEKAQASVDKLEGKTAEKEKPEDKIRKPKTILKLTDLGKGKLIVNYEKYGDFSGVGTKKYKYTVTDPKSLSEAMGEGIYPNTGGVLKDPIYKKLLKEKRLEGSHWDFVNTDDVEAAFFKWATASEPWGVKLFYIGLILEKAGYDEQAVKAYYSIVVNFPASIGWTYWRTPWYPGQTAIAKIRFILRRHPEWGVKLDGARIRIINGFDNSVANDVVIVNPGKLRKTNIWDKLTCPISTDKIPFMGPGIKKVSGKGKVRLVQFKNNHWQLQVDGKPYIIKGITYAPTKVGQSPDKGTLANWMEEDTNHNGKPDGPHDAFADKNRNNKQDADEPTVGDFQLLKEMGVNTIRVYHQPNGVFKLNKEVLRDMYNRYGIRVIIGDFLGKYAIGSGASWYEGTDYANPEHQKNMLNSVKEIVMEFKDEPFVLMWLLGNENNYGVACNADKNPEAFYKFVNEVAKWIKSVDPNHPVAIANGDTLYLDLFGKYCPNVDAFGANAYRGDYGFGSFWEQVMDASGKPAFITEYGCPAYIEDKSLEAGEDAQAEYHQGNWEDIMYNAAGCSEGVGNSVGGIAFQYLDEWWKAYEPAMHDTKGLFTGPFPDGFMHEEWLGVVGQGDGKESPFLRQLRQSYYYYQKAWKR
ncbi:MAG: glycoside hydrolase family 2 TIM barrel-domain containing protein [Candidatus Omnitrophota bacterium]|nr:glycoside hydrolase family 2 TIM barrel-domain containing protein [Candidatus Omnitrophota bacterium]